MRKYSNFFYSIYKGLMLKVDQVTNETKPDKCV